MHDWDDWRCVLALARAGTAAKAARLLGRDVSTIKRRANNLSHKLGAQLFSQQGHSYHLTDTGKHVFKAAEHMEAEVLKVEKRHGVTRPLTGTLRVMMGEELAGEIFNFYIDDFHEAYPDIELELINDSRNISLAYLDADVALQSVPPREGVNEVGERLCSVAWSCYVSPRYKTPEVWPEEPEDLCAHTVIAPSDRPRVLRWLLRLEPPVEPSVRSTSLMTIRHLALNGLGIAMLPCYLGDAQPELSRLFPPIGTLSEELWSVCRKEVQRTARVQAFFDTIGKLTADDRNRMAHPRPPARSRGRF